MRASEIVLLPEPATPNSALVSPNGSWNETPRSTSLSSNARCTSSKTIAEPDGRLHRGGERDRGAETGVDMRATGTTAPRSAAW